ncbi:MAG: hypothetical protein KZY74_18750 [Paenibacillaceae bacterium]|uniref:AraC-type arabinose-binding/dimerisation domain-containing protein n=1 Tax=Paenibacillus mellifer TaxID=2937794 RepID=A0A9X2BN53_9BACL|nr:AraC family ligand binding domain-containing protein [Paenibacillus mellifer]MBW4841431.1 hypothetical protein [Paenibacillaceae bacterium]MCK8486454.1 hypothetical protein [Paenibacillus mellifer]
MAVWTEGRTHHPGYRLAMSYQSGTYPQIFTDRPHNGDGFGLILALEGAGTWQAGEYVYPLLAPAIYCLNPKESVQFMAEAAQDGGKGLWFYPGALNERLDGMLSIKEKGTRNPEQGIASTDIQDMWLLESFLGAAKWSTI